MKYVFLKFILNNQKNYITFTMIYHFYHKKMKTEKVEKLTANLPDKTEYVIHIKN